VGVRFVDGEVRPVDAVAVDAVGEVDGAVVAGYSPGMRGDPLDGELPPAVVVGAFAEDVLRELVERVAARRGPAETNLKGARTQAGKERVDLHDAAVGRRKGERVDDGRIGLGGRRGPTRKEHGQREGCDDDRRHVPERVASDRGDGHGHRSVLHGRTGGLAQV